MTKRTIDDIKVSSKRVLVRLDLNVPLDALGEITDDRRIRAALPTIRKLLDGRGKLVLMSHLGRPTGDTKRDKNLTLRPVAKRLAELLGQEVPFSSMCIGDEAERIVDNLSNGQCCLLENLRFRAAETIKDAKAADDPALRKSKDDFAAALAELGDIYVNDAFGTCHRDNTSMLTLPKIMTRKKRVIGYLIAKELQVLGDVLANPKRPFVAILGGAKVSDKVGVIEALLEKCDRILIGGAMANTFAAAAGQKVGKSLVEPDRYELANAIREKAGDKLMLPVDSIAAADIDPEIETQVCGGDIPDDLMGLDIGPKTIKSYCKELSKAKTIVWNGPMGVFETPPFDAGTLAIANAVADATDAGATSIVGGGDSAAAIDASGVADRITHISTGGGASLKFLEGKPFEALDVLDDA